MIDCRQVQTGDLTMPRAPPPCSISSTTWTQHAWMSIPRTPIICTWYLVFAMYIYIYVCLEASDYRFFVARTTNRHGHWVCCMPMGGKNSFKHTASSSVDHMVQVTVKRRLFLTTSVIPISRLKIVYSLDGGPSQGWMSAVLGKISKLIVVGFKNKQKERGKKAIIKYS